MKAENKKGTLCITAERGEEIDPLALRTTAAAIIALMRYYEKNDAISGFLVEGKESESGIEYEFVRTDDDVLTHGSLATADNTSQETVLQPI